MHQNKESIFGTTFAEKSPDIHSHWPGSGLVLVSEPITKSDQLRSNTPQKTTVNHRGQQDGIYLSHVESASIGGGGIRKREMR